MKRNNRLLGAVLSSILLGAFIITLFVNIPTTSAQSKKAHVREARVIKADDIGVPNPAGIVYSPRGKAFYVTEGKKRGQANTDLIKLMANYADRAGSARISAAVRDPRNMAFDPKFSRLLIFQGNNNHLVAVSEGADGNLDPQKTVRLDTRHLGVKNAQGLAVDPSTGNMYFLDAADMRVVLVVPEPDGTVDKSLVVSVDLKPLGLTDLRGIAWDTASGNLHVLDAKRLVELTAEGKLVAERDLSEMSIRDPQGMAFAPSGDQTDKPAETSLYITDQGNLSAPTTGRILELTFSELPAAQAATATGTLIRTVLTSQWSPPSPDPSGLAYHPNSGTLLISDGEVNEMPQYFTGDNLFRASLAGTLVDTLTTTSYSDEPSGLEVNYNNGHLFVSDDTGTRSVYQVNPGSDGQYNTSDDSVTNFRTSLFNSGDPEGLAYDPATGSLFVVDGVNREVYRIFPGPNGIFDGVAPNGDDQYTQFDTLNRGLDDPEGAAFNTVTGTLYVVGKPANTLFEFTPTGALVQTINISAAGAKKPAGLAVGPSSIDPNELSLYLVARGVDNDSDPNENDGKLYEIALGIGTGGPTSTSTPTNTATATATAGIPTNTSTPTITLTPTNTPTITNTLPPTNTPTATLVPNTITLPVAADARVLLANPNTNYGSSARLDVDNPGEKSYLRLNVSGVNNEITSAVLRLYVSNGSSNAPSLYLTANSWAENTLTWNNAPAATGGVVANIGAVSAGTWAEYDISSVITGNGSYDIVLLADSTDGITFHSREGGSPPELVLNLGPGPAPTATDTPAPTITNTLAPTATATNTPTATNTASGPTATATNTPTPTETSIPTNTPTPTETVNVTSITVPSSGDARVLAANPDTNYATAVRLDVDNPGEKSYIRFDVSGVTGTVTSATLRLNVTNGSSNGPTIYLTTNTWAENTITWNNAPAETSGPISSVGAITASTWAEFDVTSVVTGDGSYDFVLLPDSSDGASFTSRDGSAALRPQLVVNFE